MNIKKPYNNLNDREKNYIVDLYNNHVSFFEISNKLNVSNRSVYRILKENGFNLQIKNRYTLNDYYFEKIDTCDKAYWLGYIYADGFVGNEKYNNIVLNVSEKDKDHLIKFSNCIDFSGKIRTKNNGSGFKDNCINYVLNFSSKTMANNLRKWGLYPNKSLTIQSIPDINENLINHFILGYFDGDGSIGCYENKSIIKDKLYIYQKPSINMIGTKPFLENIAKHLPVNVYYAKSKSDKMFYLRVSGKKNVGKLMQYLYAGSTMYLERKYNKWIEIAPLCSNT